MKDQFLARPYKEAWSEEEALAEMEKLSGKLFDPDILEVFVKIRTS